MLIMTQDDRFYYHEIAGHTDFTDYILNNLFYEEDGYYSFIGIETCSKNVLISVISMKSAVPGFPVYIFAFTDLFSELSLRGRRYHV
jgi:hypothetical protein